MELVRGAVSKMAHLSDGLHPGLSGGALGHDQDPDGLDGTVLRLAGTGGSAADGGPSGSDGVERVGFAVVPTGLPVLPVYDDLDAASADGSG